MHLNDRDRVQLRIMSNGGECLGIATLDIFEHLKSLKIGEKSEMISLRLKSKKINSGRHSGIEHKDEQKHESSNGILILTANRLQQTVKADGTITAKPPDIVYEVGDIIEFEHPNPKTFQAVQQHQKELIAGFNKLDTNRDGHLTVEEIKNGFRKIGFELDEDTMEKLADKQDANGDGKVTLEEFLEYSNNEYISGVLLEINEMLEETTYDVLGFDGKTYRVSQDQLRLTKEEAKKRQKQLNEQRDRKIAEIKYNSILGGAIVKAQDRQRIRNKKTKVRSLKAAVSGMIMSNKVKNLINVKQADRFQVFIEAAEGGRKFLQRKADKAMWLNRTKSIVNSQSFKRCWRKQENLRIRKCRKLLHVDVVASANKRILEKNAFNYEGTHGQVFTMQFPRVFKSYT